MVGVFHDVLLTLGMLSLTHLEFSMTSIAALLTVIGYIPWSQIPVGEVTMYEVINAPQAFFLEKVPFLGHLLGPASLAPVVDHDRGASLCKEMRRGPAHPTRCARQRA